MENLGLKRVTGKIFETKELCKDGNIALELCIGYRAGGKRGQGNSGGDWDAGEAWGLDDALAEVPTLRKA